MCSRSSRELTMMSFQLAVGPDLPLSLSSSSEPRICTHKRRFRRVYPLESLGCSAAYIKCRNEHQGSVSVTLFVSLAAITGTFQSSELQTGEIQQPAWFRVTAHCVTSFIWKIIFRLIEIIPTPAVEKSLKRSRATRRAPGRMGGWAD